MNWNRVLRVIIPALIVVVLLAWCTSWTNANVESLLINLIAGGIVIIATAAYIDYALKAAEDRRWKAVEP